jgi:hypothetical protein
VLPRRRLSARRAAAWQRCSSLRLRLHTAIRPPTPASFSSPAASWRPRAAALPSKPSSLMTSMVAAAAAQPSALPPYVPPCIGRRGAAAQPDQQAC